MRKPRHLRRGGIAYDLSLPVLVYLCVLIFGTATALAQDGRAPPEDVQTLNIDASKRDPDDYKFVKPVCTACHTPSMFLHARTWGQWTKVFDDMSSYGAHGTDEQWDHISKYFQSSLTVLDVNTSSADDLATVLEISDDTANQIVARRCKQKVSGVTDLESFPGVSQTRVEALETRLSF